MQFSKKYLIPIFVFLLVLVLPGCTNTSDSKYIITWKNFDDSILEIDESVEKGTMPTYDGATPIKPEDDSYTYTFTGWSPEVSAATSNQVYTATYSATPKQVATVKYIITWKNYNGDVLSTTEVEDGVVPTFNGTANPTRPEDDSYTYTFTGWSPELSAATSNQIYTATYSATPKQVATVKYIITWQNYDESVLTIDEVDAGAVPEYTDANPTRPADDTYTYTFTGWSPELSAATSNQVYTATYSASTIGSGESGGADALVDKKLIVDEITVTGVTGYSAQLIASEFEGGYLQVFMNGDFEFVVEADDISVLMGDYVVTDGVGYMTPIKKYSEKKYSLIEGDYEIYLTYVDEQYTFYYIDKTDENLIISVEMTMIDENQFPMYADIPDDPNEGGGNAKYMVSNDEWNYIFKQHGLLSENVHIDYSDYVVNYDSYTVDIANYIAHINGTNDSYYDYKATPTSAIIIYDYYYKSGNTYSQFASAQINIDVLYSLLTGIIPVDYTDTKFDSYDNCYYASKISYVDPYENTKTVYQFKAFFEDGKLIKVQYDAYSNSSFNQPTLVEFSNYGETTVTLPTNGSNPGGNPTNPVDFDTYLEIIQNKVLVYNRVTNSGDLTNIQLGIAQEVSSDIILSIFDDNTVQIEWPEYFYADGEKVETNVFVYGTINYTRTTTLSGKDCIAGDISVYAYVFDGTTHLAKDDDSISVAWYIEDELLRLRMEDTTGRYYVYFEVTETEPEFIPIPEIAKAQWPIDDIEKYFDDFDLDDSITLPELENAFDYQVANILNTLYIIATYDDADEALEDFNTYVSALEESFELIEDTDESYFDLGDFKLVIEYTEDQINISISQNIIASGYPYDEIAAFLENLGITDSVPDFVVSDSNVSYDYMETEYFILTISDVNDIESTIADFDERLVNNAYLDFGQIDPEFSGTYASPSFELIITILENDGDIKIYFYSGD